jgi:hypothetical protein
MFDGILISGAPRLCRRLAPWCCVAAIVAALTSPAALAQSCGGGLAGAHKVESAQYLIVFRTAPEKIAVGSHFAMEFAVCPKNGAPAPERVQVDGYMPEHQHGMNYRAAVKPAGNDRYRAEGMMLHMPGKWDFIFEIKGSSKTERLSHGFVLE